MAFKAVTQRRLKEPDDYELITYNMMTAGGASRALFTRKVYISFGIIFYWKKTEVEPYSLRQSSADASVERGGLRNHLTVDRRCCTTFRR